MGYPLLCNRKGVYSIVNNDVHVHRMAGGGCNILVIRARCAYTCIHHRIQLAFGDMTMRGWKPTISLIHPTHPPPTPHGCLCYFRSMQGTLYSNLRSFPIYLCQNVYCKALIFAVSTVKCTNVCWFNPFLSVERKIKKQLDKIGQDSIDTLANAYDLVCMSLEAEVTVNCMWMYIYTPISLCSLVWKTCNSHEAVYTFLANVTDAKIADSEVLELALLTIPVPR